MAKKNSPHDVFKHIKLGHKDECWPWTGAVNKKDGRPYFKVDGEVKAAYVWALELYTGEKANGRSGLHSCDNGVCCNPHHLRWGTHQENMDDMVSRDRHGLPKTVLRNIRTLLASGRTHESIAELYGCSRETITAINRQRLKDELANATAVNSSDAQYEPGGHTQDNEDSS